MLRRGELEETFKSLPETDNDNDYEAAVKVLELHFGPLPHPLVAHLQMKQTYQRKDDSREEFHKCIWYLSMMCEERCCSRKY